MIEFGSGGILSFRHELIADYFAAEYLLASTPDSKEGASLPLSAIPEELLESATSWSVPIALSAGLLETPIQLAEQFAILGSAQGSDAQSPISNQSPFLIEALALSLVCLGVAWSPPQAVVQPENSLPPRLAAILTAVLHDQAAREELAHLLQECYEEGAEEIYRSLILLLPIEGAEEFFVLLDRSIVLKLLFSYLSDTADALPYEEQVKRLSRALSHFGADAAAYASELSQPAPGRSMRLRSYQHPWRHTASGCGRAPDCAPERQGKIHRRAIYHCTDSVGSDARPGSLTPDIGKWHVHSLDAPDPYGSINYS